MYTRFETGDTRDNIMQLVDMGELDARGTLALVLSWIDAADAQNMVNNMVDFDGYGLTEDEDEEREEQDEDEDEDEEQQRREREADALLAQRYGLKPRT